MTKLQESSYEELLQRQEWKQFRKKVLQRDGSLCRECQNAKLKESGTVIFYQNHSTTENIIHGTDFDGSTIKNQSIYKPSQLVLPEEGFLLIDQTTSYKKILAYKYIKSFDQAALNIILSNYLKVYSISVQEYAAFLASRIFNKTPEVNLNYQAYVRAESAIDRATSNFYCKLFDQQDDDWQYVSGIHVHHTRYILNKLPWEYSIDLLITLCWSCHENLHKDTKIPVYNSDGILIGENNVCVRCYGARTFPHFKHVENGVCFRCGGTGYEPN